MRDFDACFLQCPSRLQLASFWAVFQPAIVSPTIKGLKLNHFNRFSRDSPGLETLLLNFEDLQPCMAFSNLRFMDVDIGWNVGLTDGDLLTLTTAWPSLEGFSINAEWGWGVASGGITPSGLLQVLRTCRSLNSVSLQMDTRGYNESPPPESPGLTPLRPLSICVVDSVLDAESIPAMAAFFAGIASPYGFNLYAGDVCMDLWEDVNQRVCEAIYPHSPSDTTSSLVEDIPAV
ncbi:hypothetical protein L210DRAFT_2908794 [Boletus edulis BED1]|uniref:Uncharacterized protein n=1 Tax=Boletus edulis BED1 TaxID=1328754 RepID=A0AAD4BJ79_BOLED|nr:hypothetical protein L210DRAFT_2908794 [Boletus edulis BED1]